MNKKIFYISDFFVNHVLGGGELNDDELIKMLDKEDYDIIKCQSHLANIDILQENKDSFFIVSNFCNLKTTSRRWLEKNARYVIYEHDHKYISSRNPAPFKDFKAPSTELRDYFFYKNAISVLAQSSFHQDIIKKNLDLDNVVNLSGNLWPVDSLILMNALSTNPKQDKCSILKSNTYHKNTYGAVQYCRSKNLDYELLASSDYYDFLKKISRNKKFVFLPQTPETLSRVVVEARMLGLTVATNSLVGASYEPWFELKGPALVNYMMEKREEILSTIIDLSKKEKINTKKKVSIVSTFYKGEEFLEGFLQNMVEQTMFDECELVIIDSASPGKEQEIVKKYIEKYENIFYYRIEEKLGPTPCFNMAIKKTNTDYITFGFIDDRKSKDCIETLYSEIKKEGDLIYGDVAQTVTKNETFEEAKNKSVLFEHSTYPFSRENMVKCLPGPMPLWKREIHDKCGFFNEEECNFADDWEMWLRAVDKGFTFKKIDKVVGLYLTGGRSQQENNMEQLEEESRIFFKFKHIFGNNFNVYEPYFKQFI